MATSAENAMKSLQFLSATFMGIVFWEFVIWLPNEVYVWRKLAGRVRETHTGQLLRVTAGESVAIWLRYAMVGCAISVGFLDFGRPASCQAAVTMTWVFGCLCWAGISLLFTLRLYIMYNRSRIVLAGFGFAWLVALAMWIAVAATWRAARDPTLDALGGPWCLQSNTASYRTGNWGAEMAFDILVLAATLYRLRQLHAATSGITVAGGSSQRMKAFILRSNLGYFLVSFLLSFCAFVVQTTVDDVILSQVLTPPAISLTPIVAIRIVFSATNDAAIDDIMPPAQQRRFVASGGEEGNRVESSSYDHKQSPDISMQSRRLSPRFTDAQQQEHNGKVHGGPLPASSHMSHASRRTAVEADDGQDDKGGEERTTAIITPTGWQKY